MCNTFYYSLLNNILHFKGEIINVEKKLQETH